MLACHYGNLEVVSYLITKGADVNAKDNVRYYVWIWLMMDRWINMMIRHIINSLVDMWYLNHELVVSLISNDSKFQSTYKHNCFIIWFIIMYFLTCSFIYSMVLHPLCWHVRERTLISPRNSWQKGLMCMLRMMYVVIYWYG